MHRFYAENLSPSGETELSPEDTRHALRVLRLTEGSEIELFTGGNRYRAVLCAPSGENLAVRVLLPLPSTEPRLALTLFQGLPKADKMEWIIQKAVELGVSRIVPLRMSRCVVRLEDRDVPRKLERWRRIAREAGKQSGRCMVPEISAPLDWQALAIMEDLPEICAVPWEEAKTLGPLSFARQHPALRSLGIVIGPEGGISPEEMALLPERFVPLTLGPRILRTETAGMAAAAAFLSLYGEMES